MTEKKNQPVSSNRFEHIPARGTLFGLFLSREILETQIQFWFIELDAHQ